MSPIAWFGLGTLIVGVSYLILGARWRAARRRRIRTTAWAGVEDVED